MSVESFKPVASHLNAVQSEIERQFLYYIYVTDPRTGDEILGYVGKTIAMTVRFKTGSGAHMKKNWGPYMTRMVTEVLPIGATPDDLSVFEVAEIQRLAPPLNYKDNVCPVTGENRLDVELCRAFADAEAVEIREAVEAGLLATRLLNDGSVAYSVGGMPVAWRLSVRARARVLVLWRLVRIAVVVNAVVLGVVACLVVWSGLLGVTVPGAGLVLSWWQFGLVAVGAGVLASARK